MFGRNYGNLTPKQKTKVITSKNGALWENVLYLNLQ